MKMEEEKMSEQIPKKDTKRKIFTIEVGKGERKKTLTFVNPGPRWIFRLEDETTSAGGVLDIEKYIEEVLSIHQEQYELEEFVEIKGKNSFVTSTGRVVTILNPSGEQIFKFEKAASKNGKISNEIFAEKILEATEEKHKLDDFETAKEMKEIIKFYTNLVDYSEAEELYRKFNTFC